MEVEEREYLFISDRSRNWGSNYGNSCGGSSKKKKLKRGQSLNPATQMFDKCPK